MEEEEEEGHERGASSSWPSQEGWHHPEEQRTAWLEPNTDQENSSVGQQGNEVRVTSQETERDTTEIALQSPSTF